ncbi:MAG: hypothetical protein KAT91_00520 [Candidatus Aenigmarchaeota archaeon]|nr:hypothetical protein [Candidatus Aenigmarchaeota archaeon]
MNHKLFVVLVAAILIAGCTGGSGFDKNAGATIKEYSIDFTDLIEREETGILLTVQNVGGKTMPGDSKLWLYGPTFSDDSWIVTGSIESAKNGMVIETDKFLPPDTERGAEGSLIPTHGTLKFNGSIPEGLPPQQYVFNARLCYPYITSAASVLKTQSKNEYRINPQKKTAAQTVASAGPIHISLRGSENIRRSGNSIQLVFDVDNVGSGNPLAKSGSDCSVGPDIPLNRLNKVTVDVTLDGATIEGCQSKNVSIDKKTNKGILYCSAVVSDTSDPEHEFHVTATATYDYYITRELVVSVADDGTGDA